MQVSSHGHLPFNCLAPRLELASGSAGAMLAPCSAPRLASPTGKRAGPIPSRPVGSRRVAGLSRLLMGLVSLTIATLGPQVWCCNHFGNSCA